MTAIVIEQPRDAAHVHLGTMPERRHSLAAAAVGFLSSTAALTALMVLLSHS
jgi:hypothetical protein